jgi:ankyrin repeat protein
MLIHAGARVSAANDNGATPLHVACMNRGAAMVELLLKAGADANAKLLNGETVLMTCTHTGDAASVNALLSHGANVNEQESGHHQSALMWAAAQGHSEVVGILLKAGADFQARSLSYVQTVVGEETQRAGREELNYDVIRGGSTPLLFAARNGDVASARLLLEAGADPNDALPDGTSALVLAAHSGHGDVGKLLLEKGADPNAFGIGYAALHAAVLRSEVELVRALLEYGADPNIRMTKGTPMRRQTTDYNLPNTLIGATPYLLAARFVQADAMRILAAGGADTSLAMPDGTSALMAAAGLGVRRGRNRLGIAPIDVGGQAETEEQILDAVKAAVEAGGDVNRTDDEGTAALHGAATNRYDLVIEFLAEHGADVNLENALGQTPLAALRRAEGRRGQPAPSAGESPDGEANSSTAELLLRLGAVE